jgi:hypothetical protein
VEFSAFDAITSQIDLHSIKGNRRESANNLDQDSNNTIITFLTLLRRRVQTSSMFKEKRPESVLEKLSHA